MKMTKKLIFIMSFIFALSISSCMKDDYCRNTIRMTTEQFKRNEQSQKASVDGKYTYWVEGDEVLINNIPYTAVFSDNNEAVAVNVVPANDHIYEAIYPSSSYIQKNGNNVRINVPSNYFYKERDGLQVLDGMPMVAYYSGTEDPDHLDFKHVTSAITVRVKNERSTPIDIDRIEVINDRYKMSGEISIDLTQCNNGGTPAIQPTENNEADTVSIIFAATKKRIPSEGYVDIQVPILPIGSSASKFTINVYSHFQGSKFSYNRSTSERNNSIARGCIGYAITKYTDTVHATDLFETETKIIDGKTLKCFEIHTADELVNLSSAMDSLWSTANGEESYNTANYVLAEDIDMKGQKMTPIHYYNIDGDHRCYFDGQGHTVSNFTSSSVGQNEPNCCGFFGTTSGDSITIMNLTIENANYEFAHVSEKIIKYDDNPSSAVGGIYAVVNREGIIIENCHVRNIKMGSIDNVKSGEMQTDFYASGIVGLVTCGVTIRNCSVGTVCVDNTYDASSSALVDQFGAAIGRIDVGNKSGSHTYGTAGDACPVITVEHFTYDQGSTQLVFSGNLKNIRYGGLIANLTRVGKIIMIDCHVNHNAKVYKPTVQMFCGGMIGCNKSSYDMGLYLESDCSITGTIDNQAVSYYDSSYQIERYVGNGKNHIIKLSGSSSTCTNTLTVTGLKSGFKSSSQTF